MKNLLLLLLVFGTSLMTTQAQELSWRKHRKLAQSLEKEGDLFAAAENFRMAWEKKQSKEELIYQAAELYFNLNDYRNAAKAYQHVSDGFADDKLVLLKYGRALKQDGQYDKARTVFQQLKDGYTGPDKAILIDIVQVELRGIDITRNLTSAMDRRMEILHPGANINSDSDDFSPVIINNDAIYFSSTIGGQARIYESKRQGRNWSKATTPSGFPVVQGGQYANGTMSPDKERFYFTICNNDEGWDGFNTRCELYVTKRSANGWTKPEALPDYINASGVNSTHPGVAHITGQEYLFFSSNREGGRGGLDLWYVTRDLGTDNTDFTFPVNLGPVVNSLGDEVSPFYDAEDGVLFFGSNGHPSIGGLDIFKSTGGEVTWSTPMNMGLPLNSSADDYGYAHNSFGGFLTSNRPFGGQKTNTRNEDIFEFTIGGRQITLKANVYSQDTGELIEGISVELFQLFDDGSENSLINKNFTSGSYLFELLPNRRFRVEVKSNGYQQGGYVFSTDDPASFSYGQPLFLNAAEGTGNDVIPNIDGQSNTIPDNNNDQVNNTTDPTEENTGTSPSTNPGTEMTTNTGEEYTARGTSAKDNVSYTSVAPRFEGTYYRIQVAALGKYNPTHSKFKDLPSFGPVYTEDLATTNLTRVLVGDYFNQSEAQTILSEIQRTIKGAFVVKYDDGVRYGRYNFK